MCVVTLTFMSCQLLCIQLVRTSLIHLVSPHTCTHTHMHTHTHMRTYMRPYMHAITAIGEDVTLSPSAVTSGRGNRAEFTCSLPRSNPQPTVKWIKNGSTIVNSSRFEILLYQDTSRMVISPLELEDAGEYICEVENEAGNRSAMAALTVQGKSLLNASL